MDGKFSFNYTRSYTGKLDVEQPPKIFGMSTGEPRYNRDSDDTIEKELRSRCLSMPASGNPNDIWGEEFIYFDGSCLVRISVPYVDAKEKYDRKVRVELMPKKELPTCLEDLFTTQGFHKIMNA